MSIFGWSLPPGCSTLPGEEGGQPACITAEVGTLPPGVLDVWFDGEAIYETITYTVPADEYNGTPEYTDTNSVKVCDCDTWDDDLTERANNLIAAERYKQHRLGKWEVICKRTDDPKLAWMERWFQSRGIPTRRNGHSFHAPILEVPAEHHDTAWKMLSEKLPRRRMTVDDMPDDHPLFTKE